MYLVFCIMGIIFGYVSCSIMQNRKTHGELFVIEKDGENPEIFVGIDDVDELIKHNTIQLTVKKSTQK